MEDAGDVTVEIPSPHYPQAWVRGTIQGVVVVLGWVGIVLALPVQGITWTIIKVREALYDPKISEFTKCPGCGHSEQKTLKLIRILGVEKAMIELGCLVCSATFHLPTIKPVQQWMPELAKAPPTPSAPQRN